MIHLYSNRNEVVGPLTLASPLIVPVTGNADLPRALRPRYALRWNGGTGPIPDGYGLVLLASDQVPVGSGPVPPNTVRLASQLDHLGPEDIIKFVPGILGIHVLFRRKANSNSFLLTERCNSFCLMCSQPPRDIDDGYRVGDILATLPLIPKDTVEIGFTGGEPTLLGDGFLSLIQGAKTYLPDTALHVLSNGRNFKDLELAAQVARIKHPDLMFGIPLYADYSQLHDYVVQADNAFDDTVRGILNLKRCRQRVEIRVVIHRENYTRLPRLAEFIVRNLLFVDHVALMGLEPVGFAKSNLDAIWIDPYDYREELAEAVAILDRYRMWVSIYNHPLCVLPERIWGFSVKSISDWKNEYFDECRACSKMGECGGFFSSHSLRRSVHIQSL